MVMSNFYRLIFMFTWCVSGVSVAEQSYYRNVIIGERAQGLGGAYAGVSDDASGVYYNPGGLAFAQSNDISGSANAFYSKKITYKKAFLGVSDFVEESGGAFAPFFGVMQKLDKYLPGLVGGFAYYTLDTELKDQDDFKYNVPTSLGPVIQRFHRAATIRAATYAATGALAYRFSPRLGLGVSLGYLSINELTQISQNLTATGNNFQMQSLRDSLNAHGVQVGIGVQWAPSAELALGAMIRSGKYASQKFSQVIDKIVILEGKLVSTAPSEFSLDNPLGSIPLEIRAGAAWFASPRLLVTTDVDWHEAVSDTSPATANVYGKQSVLNYAMGTEYYMTSSLPLRFGLFTNKDARPMPEVKDGEPDHIDYTGSTLFLAWAQPNSQVSAGVVVQKGSGKAKKVQGNSEAAAKVLQDIEAFAYTLGFSATHNF